MESCTGCIGKNHKTVKGKPNDALSSQCSYLGNPDGFSDFMSAHPSIKHVFCSLSMEEGRYKDVYKRQIERLVVITIIVRSSIVCSMVIQRQKHPVVDVYKRQVQAAPIKSTANNCLGCFMFIFTFQV